MIALASPSIPRWCTIHARKVARTTTYRNNVRRGFNCYVTRKSTYKVSSVNINIIRGNELISALINLSTVLFLSPREKNS